jgi:hypothetical protein
VAQNPAEREVQVNGRVRLWGYSEELGRHVRVILVEDGTRLLNAFSDSGYTPPEDRS